MNLETYQAYCKKYVDFSNYNQLVDPNIFDLKGKQKSQVRLSNVEQTKVPAMVASIREEGQLAPCSVTKNSFGKWDLKEGFTRTAAGQQIRKEDPDFKLLISDGVDQIEKYGADMDAWFDFCRGQNNHLPCTPNSAADIEAQICWCLDNGYFDRKAQGRRQVDPKLWMDTAISSLAAAYTNNTITKKDLRNKISNIMDRKQAAVAVYSMGDVTCRHTAERLQFLDDYNNQLPFTWQGRKVGEVYNGNTVYFATRRRSLTKNIIPYAFEKTNVKMPVSVYLFVDLEPVEIYSKSPTEVLVERQWYRDEVKKINSHPFLKKPLIKGLWFLPQIHGIDATNKFIK